MKQLLPQKARQDSPHQLESPSPSEVVPTEHSDTLSRVVDHFPHRCLSQEYSGDVKVTNDQWCHQPDMMLLVAQSLSLQPHHKMNFNLS